MSWQAYVDDQLVGAKNSNLIGAAIIGHDGSVWAAKNLALKQGEGAALASAFKTGSTQGLMMGGTKFQLIRNDGGNIQLKQGTNGFCICKTGQAILIGKYDQTCQTGSANNTVTNLAEYLIGQGC
jgi:hypothetical protein